MATVPTARVLNVEIRKKQMKESVVQVCIILKMVFSMEEKVIIIKIIGKIIASERKRSSN